MHKYFSAPLLTALITGFAVVSVSATADAGWRKKRYLEVEEGRTVAYSRFGNGSTSAPVRATRKGAQVRLPNGRWTYCRTSCSETLRVKTVDLNEYPNRLVGGGGTFLAECGIFGCLDIGW